MLQYNCYIKQQITQCKFKRLYIIFTNAVPIVFHNGNDFTEIRNKVYNCSASNAIKVQVGNTQFFNFSSANIITIIDTTFLANYNYAQMNYMNISKLNGHGFHMGYNPRFYHFTFTNVFNSSGKILGGHSSSVNNAMMNMHLNFISCKYTNFLLHYWSGNHVFDNVYLSDCQYPNFMYAQFNPKITFKNCFSAEGPPIYQGCIYKNFEPIKEIEIYHPQYCAASIPAKYILMRTCSCFVFICIAFCF